MKKRFFKFWKSVTGTTMIEYVLIASLIAVVMIVELKKVGNGYVAIYNRIGDSIDRGGVSDKGGT